MSGIVSRIGEGVFDVTCYSSIIRSSRQHTYVLDAHPVEFDEVPQRKLPPVHITVILASRCPAHRRWR